MLDRRRVVVLALSAALVLALIITVIVIVVSQQADDDPTPTPEGAATSTPSASPSPDEEAERAIETFEGEYLDMARDAAVIVSSWNGRTDPDVFTARYKQAGLTDALADSYTPVWADVFGDNVSAEITTTVDNNLEVREARGEDGSYVWRVAATVTFEGTWHADGATQVQTARTAIWWLTIDQASESITAIDQPTAEELQISVSKEES